MVLTSNTIKAFLVMYKAHRGQADKAGKPYYFHPVEVAKRMDDESSTKVALLHDVLEDTECSIHQLKEMVPLNDKEMEALLLLTHSPSDTYDEYIKKVSTSSLATKVKLADLAHNSDISRIAEPTIKDFKRCLKYQRAINYLKDYLPSQEAKGLVYVKV